MRYIITCQSKTKRKPYSSDLLLHKLKEKPLRLLSWLYYQSQYRSRLKATHGQIAYWLNMSQSSVKRAFKVLKEAGVCWWTMVKITDRYSAPNEYILHDDLKTMEAQDMMAVFFKNFYKLPLFSLFFKPHSVVQKKNDLPNNNIQGLNILKDMYDLWIASKISWKKIRNLPIGHPLRVQSDIGLLGTAHYGGTPRHSLGIKPINGDDHDFWEFEKQFVLEMPNGF